MRFPRNDAKAKEMYELYKAGYSVGQVATAYGMTRQAAWMIFKRRGFALRARCKPLPFIMFRGRKYTRRKTGYYGCTTGGRRHLHDVIWESHHGPMPVDREIHHKDGNKENNRLENLELISCSEHAKLHYPSSSACQVHQYKPGHPATYRLGRPLPH